MRGRRFHVVVSLALLVLELGAPRVRAQEASQEPPRPTLHAEVRRGRVQIDGRLDEPDWQRADVGRDFVERLPDPGARPPVDTEVRVLVDADAVYVGVTSYFAPDESPRALELTRDSFRVWDDDAVTLKFDVRQDRRSTVGFAINPAGAQIDFIALDNGRTFRREFDAVWEAAASVGDDAWVAEFRIPAAALRLPPGSADRVFGFNVSRDHNARQATYDWSHLPPEFGAFSALHFGELDHVGAVGGGRAFILNPYVLATVPNRDDGNIPFELRAGGEARLRLAEDVWLEVTALTDFSEVDLDSQVVNLDRFPLFFPERRPFFLTGLDVFAFGQSGEAQLFFTRRIGLDSRARPVPVYGGVKAYGREGPVSFGLLDVATAATADAPAANWGVARLRVNLGEASYVGALFANRTYVSDEADPEPHYTAGLDGLVRTMGQRLELNGFGAFTAREGPDAQEGFAGRVQARWRGEQWMPSASALYLREGFDPELGFIRRPAIFQANAGVPWVARTPAPGVRRIELGASGRLETSDTFDALLRISGGWNAIFETTERWRVLADAEYVEDTVRDSFELVPGLEVAPGTYEGVRGRLGFDSPGGRNPVLSLDLRARNAFFGGASYQADLDLGAALGRHFRFSVGAIGALLDFRRRDLFPTLAVNSVFSVTPSAQLVIDLVGQVNSVAERFIGMLRLRWRYLPGSDLFFVYREDLSWTGGEVISDRRATLKVSYRYDAVL